MISEKTNIPTQILKDYYTNLGISEEAVMKITGSIENGNPVKIKEAIRRFKNETYPNIVVTVDLLTTGIDVEEIENLVWNPYRGWMPVILTPKMGRFMSSIPLHQSISSICEIYTSHENGIQFTLSAEINDLLNKSTDGFKTQFVFNTSRSEIYGILSTVRNKILDWALLLEESGIVGEGMTFTEEEKKKAQETQVINNYTNNFYSDVSDVEMKQCKFIS